MTSKQRAYLKSMAMTMEPVVQIGKLSLTDENLKSVEESLEARELIKVSIQKNCEDSARAVADGIAEHLHADVVQVIGRKIVLYRQARQPENRKIVLPH